MHSYRLASLPVLRSKVKVMMRLPSQCGHCRPFGQRMRSRCLMHFSSVLNLETTSKIDWCFFAIMPPVVLPVGDCGRLLTLCQGDNRRLKGLLLKPDLFDRISCIRIASPRHTKKSKDRYEEHLPSPRYRMEGS